MAETGLSYEGDIAPLKQQYFQQVFSDPRLNPRAAAALSSQFSAEADKAFAQRQELKDRASVTRNRELQFESAKFTLEREREKAARERNSLNELAPLIATFDAIVNDPATDNRTKSRMIGQTAIQQSAVLAQNPAARIAYDATVRSLTPEDRPDTPDKSFTLGNYILKGGDPKFLPAGLADQPDVVISPLTFSSGITKTERAYGVSTAESKARSAQATRLQEQVDKAITNIGKAELAPFTQEGAPTTFKTPAIKGDFDFLIKLFGTEEEKASSQKADAAGLIAIMNPITARIRESAAAGPSGPTEGQKARSLFTPQ